MVSKSARLDFGVAVRAARKDIGRLWNQQRCSERINAQLPKDCKTHFNQKKLSRLELGDETLHITDIEVKAIAEVLCLEDSIVSPILNELNYRESNGKSIRPPFGIHLNEGGQIICNASHQELKAYLGSYNCVFFSTDSSVKEPVHGSLEIESGGSDNLPCIAHFKIFSKDGTPIKWYSGPFIINRHYRTWHCILIGQDKQEVCMLTASHFNATVHTNLMNIALAITTSAGTQKRPVVHRMLISRDKLSEEKLRLLTSQLRLNTDKILISDEGLHSLEDLASKIEDSLEKYVLEKCIALIRNEGTEVKYFRLDESLIYDTEKIDCSKEMKSWAVSQIRNYTDGEYYNKLSQTVHDICLNIIKMEL